MTTHAKGGRAPKAKGSRFERALARMLQDVGLAAEKVPLSGAAGGSYLGDLTIHVIGRDLVVEAKARARGFAQIYGWLEGRDILVVKADRCEPLVVLRLRLAAEIAMAAERGKSSEIQKFPVSKGAVKTAAMGTTTAADHLAILAKLKPRT
jgi:Holliday junction resolvase